MLEDLSRAGLPDKLDALMLTIAETWIVPTSNGMDIREIHLLEMEDLEKLSDQACERLRSLFSQWNVSNKIYAGSPAAKLVETSEEWPADLIVVGSQGKPSIDRIFLGSVSQQVVTEAHCSVRVARKGVREASRPARIIIGIDGSPGSQSAVQAVANRQWPAGSEARLITSIGISIPANKASHMGNTLMENRSYFEKIHQEIEAELLKAGLSVSFIISAADPKSTLLKEAKIWQADSIFVGSRGLGRFKRFLLGSVSTAVVSRAHCSVEVVRPIMSRSAA